MAKIIKCTACGADVSDTAAACPKCGNPIKRPSSVGKLFLVLGGLSAAALVIGAVVSNNAPPPTPKTAAEIQAEKVQSRGLELAAQGMQAIQKSMRNPDSFKLESALIITATNDVCFEYRGQNGFGGMTRESAVLVAVSGELIPSTAAGFHHVWKTLCAGKLGHEASELANAPA